MEPGPDRAGQPAVTEAVLRPLFDWRGAIASPFGPPNPNTRHLLLTIGLHMSPAGDSCWPTIEQLTEETGLSKRAVINNVAEAQKTGWLGKQENARGKGKGWRRMEYFAMVPAGVEEKVTTWRAARRASWLATNGGAPAAPRNGDKKNSGKPVDKSAKSYPRGASHAHGGASDDTKSDPLHIRFNTSSKGAKGAPNTELAVDNPENAPPAPTPVEVSQSQNPPPPPYWQRSDEALLLKAAEENVSTHGRSRDDIIRRLTEKLGTTP